MKAFFLFAALLSILYAPAQVLHRGDSFPNHTFAALIGNNIVSSSLGSSKKLYLLQFWGTSCPSSIYEFSKMDSLQRKFATEVKIILVSKESNDSIINFFEKRRKLRQPTIPFVGGDSLLTRSFPRNIFPYTVWLDSNLTVMHVTHSYNTTEKNISCFLQSGKLQLPDLPEQVVNTSLAALLPQLWQNKLQYYSYISRCITGFNIGYENGSIHGDRIRITSNCSSVAELFKTAYEEGEKYRFSPASKVVVEVADPQRYTAPIDGAQLDDWEATNSYNYELALPKKQSDSLWHFMKRDLERFFSIKGVVERRKIRCMVLVRTSKTDKLKTLGGTSQNRLKLNSVLRPVNDSIRSLQNVPFQQLLTALTGWIEHSTGLPFVDHTGYKGSIDIRFDGDMYDSFSLEAMQSTLKKYDLNLIEKECMQTVLVLQDHM